jgi:hypothetical protein
LEQVLENCPCELAEKGLCRPTPEKAAKCVLRLPQLGGGLRRMSRS